MELNQSKTKLIEELKEEKSKSIEYKTKNERLEKQLNYTKQHFEEELNNKQNKIDLLEKDNLELKSLNIDNNNNKENEKLDENNNNFEIEYNKQLIQIKQLEEHLEKERNYTIELVESNELLKKKKNFN